MTHLELARTIDVCLRDRVLVFGSLPPHGRDLDLLARAPELSVIARRLARAGFVRRGLKWAHFNGRAALSVDLIPAERWGLAHAEVLALFSEAESVEGFSSLVLPSPCHQILIAARRARAEGKLDDRSRARVEQALSRDPSAWRLAEQRAPAWNASAAMRLLRALRRSPGAYPRALKTAARLELALSVARTPGGWRLVLRRLHPRRPAVIAFSGIDGAGKSSQANTLQETLSHLGVEAFVVWPPAENVLFQMPPAIKSVMHTALERVSSRERGVAVGVETSSDFARRAQSADSRPGGAAATAGAEPVFPDLPRQRALVMHVLATLVALAQVLSFRKGARSVPGRPRVVIFDRYALDAMVYVRHRWGQGHPLRWQCRLIQALARQPLRTYLLEVTPDVAYARKRDFPLENLRGRANLYHEHYKALGARRVDGERLHADLCEEIARDVWSLLADRREASADGGASRP